MKNTITFIILIVAFAGKAQRPNGYFGRKYFVSSEVNLYTPLMYNMITKGANYPKYSKDFKKANDLLNYGVKLNFGYVVRGNLSYSFETGFELSDMYAYENNPLPGYEGYNVRIPKMALRTLYFVPKFEIANKRGLLPMGFSHQIGAGISSTKLVNRNYDVQARMGSGKYVSLNPSYVKDHLYDFDNGRGYKFLNLMYGFNLRNAIGKRLMLSYGFRYTFKIYLNNYITIDDSFIFNQSEVEKTIKHQQSRSILSFNCGFTYVL